WKFLNRVLLKRRYERLKRRKAKVLCAVSRGLGGSNPTRLLGEQGGNALALPDKLKDLRSSFHLCG
ncbi:MAG: hypothetical protein AB1489_06800, partial [Acidobacteriota bacterium]